MKRIFFILTTAFILCILLAWNSSCFAQSHTEFYSKVNSISFKVPAGWEQHTHEVVEGNEAVVYISPEKNPEDQSPDPIATFFLIVEKGTEEISLADLYGNAIVPLIEEGSMSLQSEGTSQVDGYEARWYIANTDLAPFKQTVKGYLFLIDRRRYCGITLAVKAPYFEEYEKILEKIIQSLVVGR